MAYTSNYTGSEIDAAIRRAITSLQASDVQDSTGSSTTLPASQNLVTTVKSALESSIATTNSNVTKIINGTTTVANATNATNATNASYANSAGSATNASYANSAGSATNASIASKSDGLSQFEISTSWSGTQNASVHYPFRLKPNDGFSLGLCLVAGACDVAANSSATLTLSGVSFGNRPIVTLAWNKSGIGAADNLGYSTTTSTLTLYNGDSEAHNISFMALMNY